MRIAREIQLTSWIRRDASLENGKNGRIMSVVRQDITFSATMETKLKRTRLISVAADITNKHLVDNYLIINQQCSFY